MKKILIDTGILIDFLQRETKIQNLELDDCLIAATALAEKAILATKNSKHYPMKIIKIETPGYV